MIDNSETSAAIRLAEFIRARLDETGGYGGERHRLYEACFEQVAVPRYPGDPRWLPGAVRDMWTLRGLAAEWADHPDYPVAAETGGA